MLADDAGKCVPAEGTQGRTSDGENGLALPKTSYNALPSLAVPGTVALQTLLQSFFQGRGAEITVHMKDACEVSACWHDRQALCTKLHTLQQSGLAYADSGWHASMRLVDQWFGYCNSCTQREPQPLGNGRAAGCTARSYDKAGAEAKPAVTDAGSQAEQRRNAKGSQT